MKEFKDVISERNITINALCLDSSSNGISSVAEYIKTFVETVNFLKRPEELLEYLKDYSLSKEFDLIIIIQDKRNSDNFYPALVKKVAKLKRDCEIVFVYRYINDWIKNLPFIMNNISLIPITPNEATGLIIPSIIIKIKYKMLFYKLLNRSEELKNKLISVGNSYREEKEELELKFKIKEAWFASMVHELRTPINGVVGIAHLMEDTKLNEKQKNYIKKIQNSGELLIGVINDLLDFSKLDSGKLELEYIEFDLNEVLEKVANIVGIKAKEKNLELIFNIDKNVPAKIKGDSFRLSQVLINLINNAIKFTEEGEIILKISVSKEDDKKGILLFEIIDSGIGINQNEKSKLFKTFSQTDVLIAKKYGGSGLGLAISKQLVDLMGGEIGVESNPKKGSKFYFTMPTERIDRRSYRLPSKDLMSKKVLIIDENINSANALAKMLRYFHYDTTLVNNKKDLMKKLENDKFDIVFIDDSIIKSLVYTELAKKSRGAVLVNIYLEYSNKLYTKEGKRFKFRVAKPLTQKKIFDLIVNIYAVADRENNSSLKEEILEKISMFEGIRLIVADDNSINQAIIMGLLENTGIDVILANNSDEVFNILSQESDIDLVLMDLNMPIMDGIEATKQIRTNERYAYLPVIALTADEIDEDRLKDYQMQDYISKPINFRRFYQVLIKVLSNRKHEATQNDEYYLARYGFNVKQGIKRAGGNHHLYCKMVENFVKMAQESTKAMFNKIVWGEFNSVFRDVDIILAASENVQADYIHELTHKLRDALSKDDIENVKLLYTQLQEKLETIKSEMNKAFLYEKIHDKHMERKPRGGRSLFEKKMKELINATIGRRPFHCTKILEELDKYWWDIDKEEMIADLSNLSKEYKFEEMEKYLNDNKSMIYLD